MLFSLFGVAILYSEITGIPFTNPRASLDVPTSLVWVACFVLGTYLVYGVIRSREAPS